MREFAPQEDLSIFGDTVDGVPNPLIGHAHPYPTRYHGPIFNQPQFTQPWKERPYAVAPYSGLGADAATTAQTRAAITTALDQDVKTNGAPPYTSDLADSITSAWIAGDRVALIQYVASLTRGHYVWTAQAVGSRLHQLDLGEALPSPSPPTPPLVSPPLSALANLSPFWKVAGAVSVAASAYHGYKRNQSIGWALWWALMGGLAPIITPAIAVAQGFGQPKKET
jgi:hypothetical protein